MAWFGEKLVLFWERRGKLGCLIHLTVDAQCDLEIRGGSAEGPRSWEGMGGQGMGSSVLPDQPTKNPQVEN